jgi:hypothetical protein
MSKLGVSMRTINVVLNMLIVLHLAVDNSDQVLATVSEADQERELQLFTAVVQFTEGLAGDSVGRSIKQTIAYKRQQYLLAYVLDTLRLTGLGDIRDEAGRYLVLVAINLVNCIATAKRIKLRN